MSRNLCRVRCYYCGGKVALVEPPRRGGERDFGGSSAQFDGMIVANAECEDCCAKYLAWIDDRPRSSPLYHDHDRWARGEDGETHISRSARPSMTSRA